MTTKPDRLFLFTIKAEDVYALAEKHGYVHEEGDLSPSDFGPMSNALLITNNTPHGRIDAFDPKSGAFLGALRDESGKVIEIEGLGTFHPDPARGFRFEPWTLPQVFIAHVMEDRAAAERLFNWGSSE